MNWLIECGDITDDGDDDTLVDLESNEEYPGENNFTKEEIYRDRERGTAMTQLRKEVAQKIWEGYVQYLKD